MDRGVKGARTSRSPKTRKKGSTAVTSAALRRAYKRETPRSRFVTVNRNRVSPMSGAHTATRFKKCSEFVHTMEKPTPKIAAKNKAATPTTRRPGLEFTDNVEPRARTNPSGGTAGKM